MAGRTIGELGVRASTGVSIAGLLRGDHFDTGPGPEARLEAGDLLAVVGDPSQLRRFEGTAAPRTPAA
jgi:TrkA domain protein